MALREQIAHLITLKGAKNSCRMAHVPKVDVILGKNAHFFTQKCVLRQSLKECVLMTNASCLMSKVLNVK